MMTQGNEAWKAVINSEIEFDVDMSWDCSLCGYGWTMPKQGVRIDFDEFQSIQSNFLDELVKHRRSCEAAQDGGKRWRVYGMLDAYR